MIWLAFVFSVHARDIVAFHGLNQSIRSDAIYGEHDCTAGLVNFENHREIENTLSSIARAFQLGATIGHINLRRTADDKLAVFHDEDLSCRTDGAGMLSQSLMADLKKLDVGYGYTPDGKSFPTRGLGRGLMPTFDEVLAAFPGRTFAINAKSDDEATARLIDQTLLQFPTLDRKKIIYIGTANHLIQRHVQGIQMVATKQQHLNCLDSIGRRAQIRANCAGLLLALPYKFARSLDLSDLIMNLHSVGAQVWVWDVNSAGEARSLKGLNLDAVGTYRIDKTVAEL